MVNLSIQFSQGHGVYTVSICNTDATPVDIMSRSFGQTEHLEIGMTQEAFVEGFLEELVADWNFAHKPKLLLLKNEQGKWTVITASYLDDDAKN